MKIREKFEKFFWHFVPPLGASLFTFLLERQKANKQEIEEVGTTIEQQEITSFIGLFGINIETILWPLLFFVVWLMVLRIGRELIKFIRTEQKKKEDRIQKIMDAEEEGMARRERKRKDLVSFIENVINSEDDHMMNNFNSSWVFIQRDREDLMYRLEKLGFVVPSDWQKDCKEFSENWIKFICKVKPIIENEDEKNHLELWKSIMLSDDNVPF